MNYDNYNNINKIKGNFKSKNSNEIVQNAKLQHCMDMINVGYMRLGGVLTERTAMEPYQIEDIMQDMKKIFEYDDNSKKFLELAKNNSPYSKEILYTGGLYASYSGNKPMAKEYFSELAEYFKQRDNQAEYIKFSDIANSIELDSQK